MLALLGVVLIVSGLVVFSYIDDAHLAPGFWGGLLIFFGVFYLGVAFNRSRKNR